MLRIISKRGNIATGLLVPIAFILALVTLFSFVSFNQDMQVTSVNFNSLLGDLQYKQKFVPVMFEALVKKAIEDSESGIDFEKEFVRNLGLLAEEKRDPELGNLFVKLLEGEEVGYILGESDGVYVLEVEDVFVREVAENSEISRSFDLRVRFDEEGLMGEVEVINNPRGNLV